MQEVLGVRVVYFPPEHSVAQKRDSREKANASEPIFRFVIVIRVPEIRPRPVSRQPGGDRPVGGGGRGEREDRRYVSVLGTFVFGFFLRTRATLNANMAKRCGVKSARCACVDDVKAGTYILSLLVRYSISLMS